MYDSSIRQKTLHAEIVRYDKTVHVELATDDGLRLVVESAEKIAAVGFEALDFSVYKVKAKTAYHVRDLPHHLVLRKVNRNLRVATLVKQSDRDTIVKRITSLLEEGVRHRVYKLDVQDFYETLPHHHLSNLVNRDRRISRHSDRLVSTFLTRCEELALPGVPRGVALSATLAEMSMQSFDDYARAHSEVYFYARYVDDILVITSGREVDSKFRAELENQLPFGMRFNPRKSNRSWLVEKGPGPSQPVVQGAFDFLGYQLTYYSSLRQNNRISRRVDVDLAERKVKRLKSRLVRSALAFLEDHSAWDLEQRIRILSGNYNLLDFDTKRLRNVGLYCNYRRVRPTSPTLQSVDRFYRQLLTGNAGPVSDRLSAALTPGNRQSLLKYRFVQSFANRSFY